MLPLVVTNMVKNNIRSSAFKTHIRIPSRMEHYVGRLMYIFKFLIWPLPFYFPVARIIVVYEVQILLPNISSCAWSLLGQTETLEFEAEKGLLQGHAGRWVAHVPQTWTPQGFPGKHFDRQGEEGAWWVVENFLLESFILAAFHAVRSWCYV